MLFGREFSAIDIGLTVENMALCATSLGLGTCILGMFDERAVKTCIGLDKKDKRKVELVIAIGVPASAEPRPKNARARKR